MEPLPSEQALTTIHKWDTAYKYFIALIALLTLLVLAYALVHFQRSVVDGHKLETESNSYLRLNACIVSVPPQRRTPNYIKQCYDTVDMQNHTNIPRFGDGR